MLEALWNAIESVPDPRKDPGGPEGGTPDSAEPVTAPKPAAVIAEDVDEAPKDKKKDKKEKKDKRKLAVGDDVSWKSIVEAVLTKVGVTHCIHRLLWELLHRGGLVWLWCSDGDGYFALR